MHARALTRTITTALALTLGATLATVTPAYADNDVNQTPVVVDDTITLWPGQLGEIDVLANDTDPDGDDLALCRFPEIDLSSGRLPEILVAPASASGPGAGAGELLVIPDMRAHGTHTIDYYVCDYDVLVPATFTIIIRDVAPVDVSKVPGKPGRLRVTNENDRTVKFWYGHPRSGRPDGKVALPAHETVTVKVQRTRIFWVGIIGGTGVADFGIVNHIKLKGDPLPPPGGDGDIKGGGLRPDAASRLFERWTS